MNRSRESRAASLRSIPSASGPLSTKAFHSSILFQVNVMPELSRFFGIIIRMYVEVGGPRHLPHFHAYYQDFVAVYGTAEIELIAGSLPRRQQRLVEAWAELHQAAEVPVNWCPALGTVLANEEVIDGKSEVGGHPVERRPLPIR